MKQKLGALLYVWNVVPSPCAALGLTVGCLRQVKGQYPFQHLHPIHQHCHDDTARVAVS
jgi:hypothetical protein